MESSAVNGVACKKSPLGLIDACNLEAQIAGNPKILSCQLSLGESWQDCGLAIIEVFVAVEAENAASSATWRKRLDAAWARYKLLLDDFNRHIQSLQRPARPLLVEPELLQRLGEVNAAERSLEDTDRAWH